MSSNQFFPSIGKVADQADLLPEHNDHTVEADPDIADEDRPMKEIESLCMKCGEQVSVHIALLHVRISVSIVNAAP